MSIIIFTLQYFSFHSALKQVSSQYVARFEIIVAVQFI